MAGLFDDVLGPPVDPKPKAESSGRPVPNTLAPWANQDPAPETKLPDMSPDDALIVGRTASNLQKAWDISTGPIGLVASTDTANSVSRGLSTGVASGTVGLGKGFAGDVQMAGEYVAKTPPIKMNAGDFVGKGLDVIGKKLQEEPEDDFNVDKLAAFVNPAAAIGQAIGKSRNKQIGKAMEATGKVLQKPTDMLIESGILPDEIAKVSPEQQGMGSAIADMGAFAYDYWEKQQQSNRFLKTPDKNTDPIGYWAHVIGSVPPQAVGQYYLAKAPFQYMQAEKAMKVAKVIGIGSLGTIEAGGHYADARRKGLSPEQAMTYTSIYAPISMLLENGPFDVVFRGDRKMLINSAERIFGKEFTKKTIASPFMDKVAKNKFAATMTHLMFSGAAEGSEEVTQQMAEYIVGDMGGYRNVRDMSEGLLEGFVGGFFGGMMGVPLAHMPATYKENFQKKKAVINQAIKSMEEAGVPKANIQKFAKAAEALSKATLDGAGDKTTKDISDEIALHQDDVTSESFAQIDVPKEVKDSWVQQRDDRSLHEKLVMDLVTGMNNPHSVNVGAPTPVGPAKISITDRQGKSESFNMRVITPGGQTWKTAIGAIDAYNNLNDANKNNPLDLSTAPPALHQFILGAVLSNSDMGKISEQGFENIVRLIDKINTENYVFVGAGDVGDTELNVYYQNFKSNNGPLKLADLGVHLLTKGIHPDDITVIGLDGSDRDVQQVIKTLKDRFEFAKREDGVVSKAPDAGILLDVSNISHEREMAKHKGDHAWESFDSGFKFAQAILTEAANTVLDNRKQKQDYKAIVESVGAKFLGVTNGFKKDGTYQPAIVQFRMPEHDNLNKSIPRSGSTLALKSTDFNAANVQAKIEGRPITVTPLSQEASALLMEDLPSEIIKSTKYSDADINEVIMRMNDIDKDLVQIDGNLSAPEILARVNKIKSQGKIPVVSTAEGIRPETAKELGANKPGHIDETGAASSIKGQVMIWNEAGIMKNYQSYLTGFNHQVKREWGQLSLKEFRQLVIQHEMVHLFGKVDGTMFDEDYATIVGLERIGRHDIAEKMRRFVKGQAIAAGKYINDPGLIQLVAANKNQDGHLWQPVDKSMKYDPDTTYVWTGDSVVGLDQNGTIVQDFKDGSPRMGEPVDNVFSKQQQEGFILVTANEAFIEKVRNDRENAIYTVLTNVFKSESPDVGNSIQKAYDSFALNKDSKSLMSLFESLNEFYDSKSVAMIVQEINARGLSDPSFVARWNVLRRYGRNNRNQAELGSTERIDNRDIKEEEFNARGAQWAEYLISVGIEDLKGKDPASFLNDFEGLDPVQKKEIQKTLDESGLTVDDVKKLAGVIGDKWDFYLEGKDRKVGKTLSEATGNVRIQIANADETSKMTSDGINDLAENKPHPFATDENIDDEMVNLHQATQAHVDTMAQIHDDIDEKQSHLEFIAHIKKAVIPEDEEGSVTVPDYDGDNFIVYESVRELKENIGSYSQEVIAQRIKNQIALESSIKAEIQNSKALLESTKLAANEGIERVAELVETAPTSPDVAADITRQELLSRAKTLIESMRNLVNDGYKKAPKQEFGDDFYNFPKMDDKNAPSPRIAGASWYVQMYARYLNQSTKPGWTWLPGALNMRAFEQWLARQVNASKMDSPGFENIKSSMKTEVFNVVGGYEYASVLASVSGSIIQDEVLKIAKNDKDLASFYLDWMSTFARDVFQHTPGNPSAYALSSIGEGGLFQTTEEQKAFNKYYPEVFTKLTGREPTQSELASWQNERPREAYWSLIPYELKQLILWVNATIIEPIKSEGEKIGIFEGANNYYHGLIGYTPRHAWRSVEQKKKMAASGLNKDSSPPMQHRTEEEYRMASTLGQKGVDGTNFNMGNYYEAVSNYVLKQLSNISKYNLLGKMGSMVNPEMPDLNMVTYEYQISELAKAGKIVLRKEAGETETVKRWLERNNYVQPHSMSGLAEKFQGTFRAPWVHVSMESAVAALGTDYTRPDWMKLFININTFQKVLVMFFPAQFMYQMVEGVLLSPGVKMSDRIKSLSRVATAALPISVASGGMFWGAAVGLGGGALVGAGIGLIAGAALGITVGAMTPSVVKRSWENLAGIAKPWEMYRGMDPKIVEMALRNNVQMVGLRSAYSVVYDRVKAYQDTMIPAMTPQGKRFTNWVIGKFGMDDYAFQDVIPKLILTYYDGLSKSLKKKGMPEQDAYRVASYVVNRTAGSLASFAMSASEADMMRVFAFATDFTISEISTAYLGVNGLRETIVDFLEDVRLINKKQANRLRMGESKTPQGFFGKIAAPLVGAEMAVEDKRMVAKQMLAWNVKAVLNAIIWKTLIQYVLSGADDDKRRRWNLREAVEGNAMGKQSDIRLPWRDADGRDVYVPMLIFKELKNYQQFSGIGTGNSLFESIGNYIVNKLALSPKLGVTAFMQVSGIKGRGGDPTPATTLLGQSMPYFAQERVPYGNSAALLTQSLGLSAYSQPHKPLKNEVKYKEDKKLIRDYEDKVDRARFEMSQKPTLAQAKLYWQRNRDLLGREAFASEKERRLYPERVQARKRSTLRKAKADSSDTVPWSYS